MKNTTKMFLIGAVIGSALAAQSAFAAPYPATQTYPVGGDLIKIADGIGGAGGEFNVDVLNKGVLNGVDFYSFCLEKDETLSYGATYKVQAISNKAQNGGVNTNSGDLLDPRTAFLYYQFAMGSLTNYRYSGTLAQHTADANNLQNAIWYIEQEIGSYTPGTLIDYIALAAAGIFDPNQWAWGANSIGPVRVVNLVSNDARQSLRQDIITIVPEPATLLLLGTGMLGLGAGSFLRRRKN